MFWFKKYGLNGEDLTVRGTYAFACDEPLYLVRRTFDTDWPSRIREQFRNWSQR
jgi:hypothetical protein